MYSKPKPSTHKHQIYLINKQILNEPENEYNDTTMGRDESGRERERKIRRKEEKHQQKHHSINYPFANVNRNWS